MPSVGIIVGYFLIGVIAYWPVFPISPFLYRYLGDFAQSVWFIAWVPHGLVDGLNPLFSNAMYLPDGVNLAANTASPLLGLIAAPFALVLGPVARTNLLILAAMPVSATAAFVVLRRWQVWAPAAALGGLIYGFSPYMVGQSSAHVELLFVPLPPFIALTVTSILQGRGSPRRLGIQLGILFACQYLISAEIFASVAVFTIAAVVLVAIRQPGRAAEHMRVMLRPIGVALVVVIVLLAYPVWMLVAGPQHTTGSPFGTVNPFHNDLFSFVVPGPLQRTSFGMRSIGNRLTFATGSNLVEADGYIGVPVLILTGAIVWRSRRSLRMQLAAVLLIGAALLSLGPHLAINGRLTPIPLPFLLLDHVPFLKDLLPSRISFEIGACLAAVIAFGLDDFHRVSASDHRAGSARRVRRDVIFAWITLAVLIGTQLPSWPPPQLATPGAALPTSLRQAIPADDPRAITYPYAVSEAATEPMLWQAEDGFEFRLFGGYGHHLDGPSGSTTSWPSVMSPPNLQRFLAAQEGVPTYGSPLPLSPELVRATRTVLSRYQVRLAIVDSSMPGSGTVVALFDEALGPPSVSAGSLLLWSDWHASTNLGIVTSVIRPVNGASLSGTEVLDAMAYDADELKITKMVYYLTGAGQSDIQIGTGQLTPYGWVVQWDTTSVKSGDYTMYGVAYDSAGHSGRSRSIRITVKNSASTDRFRESRSRPSPNDHREGQP
jgi:hypothetical protein